MTIPKLTEQNILDALAHIDKNGVPDHNKSTKYFLCTEGGKKYPPKYVIAVADHIANGTDIFTQGYNAVEAKKFLEHLGFAIETKQEKYELTITAEHATSNDESFTMDNLGLGDNYRPVDVYFKKENGEIIRRNRSKGEQKISNQTMPRIACQIFEKQIASLSDEQKENFPVCRYTPKSELICGIFPSVEVFRKHKNTLEYLIYKCDTGRQFVIYCWNIFSPIVFVQECLKRFGAPGDCFVLTYREKDEPQSAPPEPTVPMYVNPYSPKLIESKNIIFRGAPGTGKSYLAKEIAADIISNGELQEYAKLSQEQKKQVEFVQFHPSYDYSDFVEGLRPKVNDDGSMGFELQDGIFKKFVHRAKKNFENSQKTKETIEKEVSAQEAIEDFFSGVELGVDGFKTIKGSEFFITDVDDERIHISIPANDTIKTLCLNVNELRAMLESGEKFERIKDVTSFFGKTFASQAYSYDFALYKEIRAKMGKKPKVTAKHEELKKYIFIIDEINRGEISKIFGELFFAIDPGYRGRAGEVSTQYSNLHLNLNPATRLGARTQAALRDEQWDYVVLQEMSNGPITSPKRFFSSVEELCEQIFQNGAVPILYATWAYQKDGAKLTAMGMDYDEMYHRMNDAYHQAAEQNHALIADVGQRFYTLSESQNLYGADGVHPNELGSRIAAETISEVILYGQGGGVEWNRP